MNSSVLQPMDLTSLRAVLNELRQEILPSKFEKAQQPDPNSIQIGFRSMHKLTWLEISWKANSARITQIPPPEKLQGESTLAKQIKYCLNNMALIEINQNGFERIAEFCLAKRPGEPCERKIIIEIMGRFSNLFLLDSSNRVITIGRQVRSNQSRFRPISTGEEYFLPPLLKGIEPNKNESIIEWKKRLCNRPRDLKIALMEEYQGISPALITQLASNDPEIANQLVKTSVLEISDKGWESLYSKWIKWIETLNKKNFALRFNSPTQYRVWQIDYNEDDYNTNIGIHLGLYYKKIIQANETKSLIDQLSNKLNDIKKKEFDLLSDQENRLALTHDTKKEKEEADTLLSQISPTKENIKKAQKLYAKIKKTKRSISIIKERIEHHTNKLKSIEASHVFLSNIVNSSWESNEFRLKRLAELKEEVNQTLLRSSNTKQKSNKRPAQAINILEVNTPGGLLIQIGRNHRQNELVSLKYARKGDLWFHAQECPGSHVVLKASNGMATEEDLQMACDLAAFCSRGKENQKVPVIMVQTDKLQRIKGDIPGTVRYSGGEILWGIPSKGMDSLQKLRQIS